MNKITTRNYIYLLQEIEFAEISENIYKVGMSTKGNLTQFNQYPQGYVILFQMICNNCKKMEKKIIKLFKKKFNFKKELGNEYFEGDYKTMIEIIYLIITNEINIQEDEPNNNTTIKPINNTTIKPINNDPIKQANKYKLLCENTRNIFPDYKNDESFGANNKYIKINIIDNEYIVHYINPILINNFNDSNDSNETSFVDQYTLDENNADLLQYFNKLIDKKIVRLDKILNINSTNFINKINKHKFNIILENYDEFESKLTNQTNQINPNEFHCKIREKIRQLFQCNTIINGYLYSTMVKEDEISDIFTKFKKLKDFDIFRIDVGVHDFNIIRLYKIKSKYYDYITFLKKYTPYVIRWDGNNNYYILNRDYEYIGLNNKSINYTCTGHAYVYRENRPYDNINDYNELCNEYKKILYDNSLKNCLNMHDSIKKILTLMN